MRGTRVGQAYVAVSADGSGINDDIVKSFDDVDYAKLADKNAKNYNKYLKKRLDSDLPKSFRQSLKNLQKAIDADASIGSAIDKVLVNVDRQNLLTRLYKDVAKKAGVEFSGEFADVVRARVHKNLRSALRDAAKRGVGASELMEEITKSFSLGDGRGSMLLPGSAVDKMIADVKRVAAEAEKAQTAAAKKSQREHLAAIAQNIKFDQMTHKAKMKMLSAAHAANIKFDKVAHRAQTKMLNDAHAMNIKFDKVAHRAKMKMLNDALAMNIKFDRRRAAEQEKAEKRRLDLLAKTEQKLKAELARIDSKRVDELIREEENLWKIRRAGAKAHAKYLSDLDKGRIDRFGNAVERTTSRLTRRGDIFGRMFGMGSRNNALNLLGKTIGATISVMDKMGRFGKSLFGTFQMGFEGAAEGANLFQKMLSGSGALASRAGAGIASMSAAAVAAAPAMLVLVGVMSVMASVASALVGLLTALVSTIVSGLVGGLLVLGGAFATAAAAGGLLTAAFMSMTDAQKKTLKTAFEPLRDAMAGIGQLMIRDMVPAFKTWSKNLQNAVALAIPAATVMGEAFAKSGKIITKSLSGKGFQNFADAMYRFLPTITVNFSTALGNFLNGIMGIFAAITPHVEQFSQYLANVTKRFSDWANSTKGQNSIVDFTDRALGSLKSLWNFTREFFGWLNRILFSSPAQTAGNSMFDSLARSFEGFKKKITDGKLEEWFEDAIEFGKDLKEVMKGLSDIFTALNNSGVLQMVGGGIRLIGKAMQAMSGPLGRVVDLMGFLAPILATAMVPITPLISLFGELKEAIQYVVDKLRNLDRFKLKLAFLVVLNRLLDILGTIREAVRRAIEALGRFSRLPVSIAFSAVLATLRAGIDAVSSAASNARQKLIDLANAPRGGGKKWTVLSDDDPVGSPPIIGPKAPRAIANFNRSRDAFFQKATTTMNRSVIQMPGLDDIIKMGSDARSQTGKNSGGTKSKIPTVRAIRNKGNTKNGKGKDVWKNPFIDDARKLIKNGPGITAQIKAALAAMNKSIAGALNEAVTGPDAASVQTAIASLNESLKNDSKSMVDVAQGALNDAAQKLIGAKNPKAARKALKAVRKAQADLKTATKNQKNIQSVIARLDAQTKQTVSESALDQMIDGEKIKLSTLADFAAARSRIALELEAANVDLTAALALRDDYQRSVADSIKSFGSLMTAQAAVIDGVTQALIHTDITSNLQDRLSQIRKFQDNLRVLLAYGLSQEAYRQLVDAGVENGGAYAEALVAGGIGAVGQVNDLTSQIGAVADDLGLETSSRLYQAGVDSAQGLVDGLKSMSVELEAAATALGTAIASAIQKALYGTLAPSAGTANLATQAALQAALASTSFGSGIASGLVASPRVAAPPKVAASGTAVSGNTVTHHWHITTPTTDPAAVAKEVMNEMAGRL